MESTAPRGAAFAFVVLVRFLAVNAGAPVPDSDGEMAADAGDARREPAGGPAAWRDAAGTACYAPCLLERNKSAGTERAREERIRAEQPIRGEREEDTTWVSPTRFSPFLSVSFRASTPFLLQETVSLFFLSLFD